MFDKQGNIKYIGQINQYVNGLYIFTYKYFAHFVTRRQLAKA